MIRAERNAIIKEIKVHLESLSFFATNCSQISMNLQRKSPVAYMGDSVDIGQKIHRTNRINSYVYGP